MLKLYIRIYKNLVLVYKADCNKSMKRIQIIIECLKNIGILPLFFYKPKLIERFKDVSVQIFELIYKYLNQRMSLSFPEPAEGLIGSLNREYYKKFVKLCLK